MRTVLENARAIIEAPLPDVLKTAFETVSDSRHRTWYMQGMGDWDSFVRDVQKKMRDLGWNEDDYLSTRPENPTENLAYTHNEQTFCGDEQSLVGRYSDNALGPATSVAWKLGFRIRYGDYKVCHESKGSKESKRSKEATVPDFVAVEVRTTRTKESSYKPEEPHLRLIGEVKTYWNHDLMDYYESFAKLDKKHHESELRRAFGQPAQYMHQFKMKYGFLTTYQFTIFLMQGYDRAGKTCLYYTKPISHKATPGPNSVSIRQCLLYLMILTDSANPENYTFRNPYPLKNWVKDNNPKDNNPSPASPFTDHMLTPHNPQAQRSFHTPRSRSPGGLPNIGGLSINERGTLTRNENGTYTATITLAAEQISNLDSDNGPPYIVIAGKAILLDLGKQPRAAGTQHIPDIGAYKGHTTSFKSAQERLFDARKPRPGDVPRGDTKGLFLGSNRPSDIRQRDPSPAYQGKAPQDQGMQQVPPHDKGTAPQRTRPTLDRQAKSKPDEPGKKDGDNSKKPPKSGGGGIFGRTKK